MSDEMKNDGGGMLGGIAVSGPTKRFQRLALVVANSSASYAVAELRRMVETFVVETLSELRVALTAHFIKQHNPETGHEADRFGSFLAVDITRLPFEDTRLFASEFGSVCQQGTVYVLTPQQFSLFEDGVFDFVVR
jgi:hypothetical protein